VRTLVELFAYNPVFVSVKSCACFPGENRARIKAAQLGLGSVREVTENPTFQAPAERKTTTRATRGRMAYSVLDLTLVFFAFRAAHRTIVSSDRPKIDQMASINANVWLACVLLASSLSGSLVLGQNDARSNPTHLQMVANNDSIAHLPEMERLIAALSGEWATVDTYEEDDQIPTGRRQYSQESYRIGPARLSLIEEYHGENALGKSWATGIFWWDHEAKGVHVLWCDSEAADMGCRVLPGIGKWEGDDFVLTDQHGDSGKRVFTREVWSDLKRDSFTQTIYQGASADNLEKVLTIKAVRSRGVARH
jgi:hypothetical protein